eukprot:7194273-Prymnesium_polylepis.1
MARCSTVRLRAAAATAHSITRAGATFVLLACASRSCRRGTSRAGLELEHGVGHACGVLGGDARLDGAHIRGAAGLY